MWEKLFHNGMVERKSSLGGFLKYPTLRDHPLHTWRIWLQGKRADDGAEDLWRIKNKLYDFTKFVDQHPGGKDWLRLTKGTDITEAFACHHISTIPEQMLDKYYIREAKGPRNSPFTFEKDGFYETLKNGVREELKKAPVAPVERSKLIIDSLFASFLLIVILAAIFRSYILASTAGIVMSMTAIAAHNFFHKRDNFRMYYFDFSMLSSKGWRISHGLSHHLFANTLYDLEISSLEPFLQHLPTPKGFVFRYISWLYSPIFYFLLYFGYYIKMLIECVATKGKEFDVANLLPLTIFGLIWFTSGELFTSLKLWACLQLIGSLYFSIVGVNAAHHHPDIFHDGDEPRSKDGMDWGIYQVDAVMDRKDITGSHFLVLTNFGDHALHHLFPTIDHGQLEYLYPVFKKTCKQFGIEWQFKSQIELIKGQFQQLAKVEPSKAKKYKFT